MYLSIDNPPKNLFHLESHLYSLLFAYCSLQWNDLSFRDHSPSTHFQANGNPKPFGFPLTSPLIDIYNFEACKHKDHRTPSLSQFLQTFATLVTSDHHRLPITRFATFRPVHAFFLLHCSSSMAPPFYHAYSRFSLRLCFFSRAM